MTRIKDTQTVPEEGWQYPGLDGYMIHTRNYGQLMSLVKEHYEANGQPVPSEETVTAWICANIYVECYESDTKAPLINRFTKNILPAPRGCCG